MKPLVVLNPVTGRGEGAKARPRIEEALRRHGLEYDLILTQGPGHATALARETALSDSRLIIAAGGDGTVNEVINGLIQAAQACGDWERGQPVGPLGIIPVGSGNDFAYALGLRHRDVDEACRRIVNGNVHTIDLGHIASDGAPSIFFCNNVGIGLDAQVNIESRKIKRLRGFFIYFVALLRTVFLYYRAPHIQLQCDDLHLETPIMLTSVANGPRTGGGFLIAPRAQVDDGVFDLCVALKVGRLKILQLIPYFIRGTHENQRPVRMLRGRAVRIELSEPTPIHVDGEIYHRAARRVEIQIHPGRLNVFRA